MTTVALTLFDVPPPRYGKQAAAVLANLRRLEGELGGCTAWDLYLRWESDAPHPPQQNVIARRLTDLAEQGLVRATGHDRVGGYGREITVWRSIA